MGRNIIRKAVIPAAGLGTRLLPTTKEMPKEMLPIYSREGDKLTLKPILQIIFERLYIENIRDFCFIVGRGKRAIEDHFTPDHTFLDVLNLRGKNDRARLLEKFYKKISSSRIVWINQPEPKGFGYAVSLADTFVANEPFIVHAGDTIIFSKKNNYIQCLIDKFLEGDVGCAILVKEVENPMIYGVVEVDENLMVKKIVEKPRKPPSNLAVVPVYVFDPIILKALKVTRTGVRGEIELTDAIQKIIDWGFKVYAVKLPEEDFWLDIGTPEKYWEALKISYNFK